MPKDPRLYMTFPIDFDEHPKVEPLSDAAFRVFVSMNGYSRRQRLDGRIPGVVARKRWSRKPLNELVNSHPERPLVLLEDDTYIIRDYDQHQFTTADEQKLRDDKQRAGREGGRAKAAAMAGARQVPQQNLARSESGSESEISADMTNSNPVSYVGDGAASGDLTEFVIAQAKRLGIRDVRELRTTMSQYLEVSLSFRAAVALAEATIGRSKNPVRDVDAYVATACRTSAEDVRWDYERLDLGAVS